MNKRISADRFRVICNIFFISFYYIIYLLFVRYKLFFQVNDMNSPNNCFITAFAMRGVSALLYFSNQLFKSSQNCKNMPF